MQKNPRFLKATLLGGILGVAVSAIFSIALTLAGAVMFGSGSGWSNAAFPPVVSWGSMHGLALGAATGYVWAANSLADFKSAETVARAAGILSVLYSVILPLRSLAANIMFLRNSDGADASFFATVVVSTVVPFVVNLGLWWGIALIVASVRLQRTAKRAR